MRRHTNNTLSILLHGEGEVLKMYPLSRDARSVVTRPAEPVP